MSTTASSFDGVTIAYDDQASGDPALVFIHGLAGSRSDWTEQAEYFSDRHRVVAVDLPGSGESGQNRQSWTMAAFGEDVATVAKNLDLQDLILVGHSLGGDVTVEAARRLGDRVRGLVWVSSYRSLGSPMTPEQLEEWLAPFRTDFVSAVEDLARRNFGHRADPEIVERAVATMSAANPEIVVEVLANKFANEPALLEGLKEVAAPVVAINPDFKPNDPASFDAHGIELIVMSNVGHFTMMEDPATFNEVLEETIKNLAALS